MAALGAVVAHGIVRAWERASAPPHLFAWSFISGEQDIPVRVHTCPEIQQSERKGGIASRPNDQRREDQRPETPGRSDAWWR